MDLGEDFAHSEEHINEHGLKIGTYLSSDYFGSINYLKKDIASVIFAPNNNTTLDSWGVVHTGVIECAAQYSALLAVNHEHAIINQTSSEFLSPIVKNMELIFTASTFYNHISKKLVRVLATHKSIKVYEGTISILVSENHILDSIKGFKFNVKGHEFTI
jgi:acyl-coenzyme A thioesterase PaaI-like protein